uniref:Uncharacterized protein n=1 Tax=Cannabis sativa TaxID=3483 RepID=A0A803NM68_CANSA
MCERLGHQRSRCSWTTLDTILNAQGMPFSLFGMWLNPTTKFFDCFFGKQGLPRSLMEDMLLIGSKRTTLTLTALTKMTGDGGFSSQISNGLGTQSTRKFQNGLARNRTVKRPTTKVVWVPKIGKTS